MNLKHRFRSLQEAPVTAVGGGPNRLLLHFFPNWIVSYV